MDDSSSLPTGKTVQCPRCKRCFAGEGFLRRHIRVAHGDKFVGAIEVPERAVGAESAATKEGVSDERFFSLLGISLTPRQRSVLAELHKEAA